MKVTVCLLRSALPQQVSKVIVPSVFFCIMSQCVRGCFVVLFVSSWTYFITRIRSRCCRIICRSSLIQNLLFYRALIFQLGSNQSSTKGIRWYLCSQVSLLSRPVLRSWSVSKEDSYTQHCTTNAMHLFQRNHHICTLRTAHVQVTAVHFQKLDFSVGQAIPSILTSCPVNSVP